MPTNFGTGFGPSFGFSGWNNQQFGNNQLTAPTKQQKFPGLNDEQIKRLESISSDPQRQQELYKQTIEQLNSQNVKDNRIATENEMAYRNLNQKDVRQKNYTDSQIRLEQLADLTKDKFGLRQDAPTQEVVNGVIAMAQDKGVSLDEMNNYLDTGDQNFLYNLGLKENPKEKLRENAWDNIWDNIRTKANVPIDNIKKRGKRTFNEASEKIYKGILKNFVGDSIIGEMGIDLDDYVDTITDKTVTPALQQDTLNYQNKINERYRALEQKNLDQDIKNYYDNKGYTKLLKEGDFKGFLYKSMGDAAQNWEMPVVIAASVFQPEIGMALMTTDAYARENQEAFENMMNNGATYEQAEQGAVAVGLVNAAVEVTLEKLLGGVETSASSAIRKTLMKNVQEEAAKKGLGRILLEGVGTQLRSSTEEGLEEIVQQIVQNAAVKTVNENQKLFEGVGSAFEGGFYNPMNLLAGGGNINQNIQANKSEIRQSIMDTATTATTQSRDLLDAISDKAQDMGDTAKNKVSGLVDQTYGIDETLRKDIQDNPYSAQVWARTKNYIEENGRPEKSNDVAKALITDVADRVQESLMDKMEEGKEAGKLYKPLLDAGYSVDISELKDGIDEMLEKYGIKVEDGKLDFSKTAIDGSEANNIRKIYNWIKDTNKPMSLDEYKNRFRKTMSDMVDFNQVGRDQAGRKTADTQGDKVLKGIRSFANDLAHNQIPELASVDKKFNEWVQIMDEVSDGLVYKDKAKRGVIRDNISQIIKNLDTPNRRELANRLEKIMPGITEEVRAINKMPQLIDHYYKPSRQQQTLTTAAGGVVGTAVGSLVGLPTVGTAVGAGIGYWLSGKIDQLKSKKWDKIISETSEDGKAKLNDIQARIKKNEKITKEQKAFLEKMSKKLKEGKADKEAEVAKIIAEVSSAEGDVVSVLNNAIDRLETIGAKQEVKELKGWMNEIQKSMDEKAEMGQLLGGIRDQRVGGLDKSQVSSKTAKYNDKQMESLVNQLKKTGLAKDVILVDSVEDFNKQIGENSARYELAGPEFFKEQLPSRVNEIEKHLKEEYGTTEEPSHAAFIDNQGEWINGNMSGYGNYRDTDHREIAQTAFEDTDTRFNTATDALTALMAQTRLVRVNYNDGYMNIDTAYRPNWDQKESLNKFDDGSIKEINVDISDPETGRPIDSGVFESMNDAINFIERHFGYGISYLKDSNGDIAGATLPDGTVYLIKDNLRGDTPTHEFSHLLRSYAKENSPSLLNALNKIAQDAPQELKDYVQKTYGDLSEDAFLDEVFAWRQGLYSGIKSAQTWYQRMWSTIVQIWNDIRSNFGSKYADLDVFEAYEQMGSEELMQKVDTLLKGGKEIGQGYGGTQFEIAGDIYSKNFKNWFGDWENGEGSKVVDENGNPLVVYHGGQNYHTEFKKDYIGSNFGQDSQGFFFTDSKQSAEDYANNTSYGIPRENPGVVMDVYLSLKNPLIERTDYDPINLWDNNYERLLKKANANKNDGIIIKADEGESLYVAFEPNQIKSATDNVGTYDPDNTDIRYERTEGNLNDLKKDYYYVISPNYEITSWDDANVHGALDYMLDKKGVRNAGVGILKKLRALNDVLPKVKNGDEVANLSPIDQFGYDLKDKIVETYIKKKNLTIKDRDHWNVGDGAYLNKTFVDMEIGNHTAKPHISEFLYIKLKNEGYIK